MENVHRESGDGTKLKRLVERMKQTKETLERIRKGLFVEKKLLDLEKSQCQLLPEKEAQKIISEEIEDGEQELPVDEATATELLELNIRCLQEIEKKCDVELKNIDGYISNLHQIRTNWIKVTGLKEFEGIETIINDIEENYPGDTNENSVLPSKPHYQRKRFPCKTR